MTASRRAVVALAVVCGFCLGAAGDAFARSRRQRHHKRTPSGQSGSASDGRSFLKRANALAGEGDCAAAIAAYTKAFEILDDPVVLFNRAECYRRTGDNENAVDDYREFLERVPNASNRADIEAKIAALDMPEPAPRQKPAEETAPPPLKAAPPAKAAEAPPSPGPSSSSPPAPAPAPAPESRPEPVIALQRAPAADDAGAPAGSRPWVWIALSVLAVGAAVGGYLLLRPADQSPPDSALGNYTL